MTTKHHIYAVLIAGFLSRWLYSIVSSNPTLLSANVAQVFDTQDYGDVRYRIYDGTLQIQSTKQFEQVSALSMMVMYDPEHITIADTWHRAAGELNLDLSNVWVAYISIDSTDGWLSKFQEILSLSIKGDHDIVLHDVLVTFIDGRSEYLSVGVENF